MKNILVYLIVGLVFASTTVCANDIDEGVVSVGNQVLKKIYTEIIVEKWNYPELKDFNDAVLKSGNSGILNLYYRYDEYLSIKHGELYQFGVTINSLGDNNPFDLVGGAFRYVYPALGIQVVGAKAETVSKRKQFDFQPIVEREIKELWKYEQKQLPYQLSLSAKNSTLKVGERLHVDIAFSNMSEKSKKLKTLSPHILQFNIDEHLYGPPQFDKAQAKKAKTVVFKSYETKKRSLKLKAFEEPGVYEISCSYLVPYKGVFPQDVIRVRVVE